MLLKFKSRKALSPTQILETGKPGKAELKRMRFLISFGFISMLMFIGWLINKAGTGHSALFLLLGFSVGYKLLRILHEWYHYWAIGTPARPKTSLGWTVDMFTTAVPGEPFDMIRQTLVAMQAVSYPHTSYLCDEGNDPALQRLCAGLGVMYVTRKDKKDAKAGNINNALRIASGDICVILDPDHQPGPEFLDQVLPYFNKADVGFVQIVQAYGNQRESIIAAGAAQHTYAFYGPMMMGMNSYGTVQALGANCTFRRAALDAIGGHAAGLAEDMHTAMQLHAKGWKSVYVPKILARGLVPATLRAYYQQQLKWARGTFDLLFYVYPKLFAKFTWRQKLHYLLLPLHFASGIFALIDVLLPVICLLSGQVPVALEYSELLLVVAPFTVLTLLTRQYAQNWFIEKHETGFHITGGALLLATWWVYLLGFVYTVFRIKVPYLATPKDDALRNNWTLCLPNILLCLLSLGGLAYGLQRDWSPFSFIMAGYAAVNAFLLAYITFAGQHRLLHALQSGTTAWPGLKEMAKLPGTVSQQAARLTCGLLRSKAPALALLLVVVYGSFAAFRMSGFSAPFREGLTSPKSTGGFYTGMYQPAFTEKSALTGLPLLEAALGDSLNIVSLYQSWGPESIEQFPDRLLRDIADRGSMAMITWEPYVSGFPERPDAPELRHERRGMAAIASGKFDAYLEAYALKIRAYGHPVFIRFGHEADNPAYPWSATGANTPADYVAAWRQVVSKFAALGVNNVTWVWTPWDPLTFDAYYPGDQFVDWIGFTCLNYGLAAADGKWHTFEEIYHPFRQKALARAKPVMLAEFGSTNYGGNGSLWLSQSLKTIHQAYPEIKSVVFFNSDRDRNWVTAWRPTAGASYIDWLIREPGLVQAALQPLARQSFRWKRSPRVPAARHRSGHKASFLSGKPGDFNLMVRRQPFYVKGVAYNAGHEWRDGYYPLTRSQVEQDLRAIRDMGANTIRRYHPGIYDKNILAVARQQGLQVIYGFWFSPQVDYHRDTAQVSRYLKMVAGKVRQYKGEEAVLAWSIGNETSGLLKKHFHQPYLTLQRHAYMVMIERMARLIHQLDPARPVFTSLEHSWQLPGELHAFRQLAPSVDVLGINSYYTQQISQVQALTQAFDPGRPYLVSEFGPRGYWHPGYSRFDKNKRLLEDSDREKAALYSQEWGRYIQQHQGYNVGGVAYCWRDRFEGSHTWFGIVDYKNRRKPVYYALRKQWQRQDLAPPVFPRIAIIGPGFKLLPGQAYPYKVLLPGQKNSKQDFTIEWHLFREDYLEEINSLEPGPAGNEVRLVLPEKGGHFRLYVYVSDKKGNVVTASKPIAVYHPGSD